MKKNILIALIGMVALLFMPAICSVAGTTEEDVTPRKIYLEPQKSLLEKGKLKFLLAMTAGHDSNSHLDSDRNADGFGQTYFKASFLTPISKKTDATIDYEMMNLLYAGEKDLDLSRNSVRFGLDHRLSEELTFSAGYAFDSIAYWHAKKSDNREDYLQNALDFKLHQKLPNKMYHSASYEIWYRNYLDLYTRTDAPVYTDKERIDVRNVLGYEVGKYFKKDLVKLNLEYFNNNSNETYLKYYDYDSYKVGSSLTHLFNKTISGYLSYYWQYRDYRSRPLVADAATTEKERTSLATAALFYTLNKSVSFGLNYTYRQNSSNEPQDKYSGALISFSTYFKF
jgi:hypothetical protein